MGESKNTIQRIKYLSPLFFLLPILISAQTLEIFVTDHTNQPLSGAVIFNQNQSWTQLSGEQGEAIIPFLDSIFVQYLGLALYKTSWEQLEKNAGHIQLLSTGINLPEIVVQRGVRRRDLSQQKLSLSAIDIQSGQLSTPVDALADAGGAFIQKSQHGGGSPIIRGFEANRVLLMVDGVRLNNAIYRSGHLQNGITIDESALASVDLTYGPGALAYGSDALGGVLHFKTKEYLPATQAGMATGWNGQAFVRLATAKQEATAHLGLAWRGRKWSSYTAFTASKFGDALSGNNRPNDFPDFGKRLEYVERINGVDSIVQNADANRQIGSAYHQIDVLQKVIWQASSYWQLKLNLQFSNSSDVPRYDALSEYRNGQLRFAEWYYGPQQRLLGALTLESNKERWYANWLRIIISRQQLAEDRYQRKLYDPWREVNLVDVTANNFTIDAQKRWSIHHSIQYGLDARWDKVTTTAFQEKIETGERSYDVNTRYPSGGSNLKSTGFYAQYRYSSRDSSLLAEAGIRLSSQSLKTVFSANDPIEWPLDYLDGVGSRSQAFTWAGGLRWKPSDWAYRIHFASGFRAPNVDDFAKFREKNGFVQIPNPTLKPEQSISVDFTVERSFGQRFDLNATVFYTRLNDIIVRQNFQLPNSDVSFLSNGDTLFVQSNVNSGRAKVSGYSLGGRWQITDHWQLKSQLNFTQGKRLLNYNPSFYVPLGHIPPLFGNIRVDYRKTKWEFAANIQFQAAKKLNDYAVTSIIPDGDDLIYERLGSSDNLENSPFDTTTGTYVGSYSWWTLQLQSSYKISSKLRVRLHVNNLFDVHYRTFSSGVSAQGRMAVLGLYAWF